MVCSDWVAVFCTKAVALSVYNMQLNLQGKDDSQSESGMESQKSTNTSMRADESQSDVTEEIILGKRTPQSVVGSVDSYSAECLQDEKEFFEKAFNKEKLPSPLDILAGQLQDFYDGQGDYYPKKRLPFAEDVLVGVPENICSAQSELPKLGLPDDFGGQLFSFENCPNDPNPFWYGSMSTRLGRLGGKEATSKEAVFISEEGSIYREFETHGRVTPLLDQSIFLKRRVDQDLTSIFNEHYKDTPEEDIPKVLSWNAASEVLDQQLPLFVNPIENRNRLDREAAVKGFLPVSRLETNVIQSEMQRRKNISNRPLDIDDEKNRQLERNRQKNIAYRARQKAARLAGKPL
jgi:hypothetical protein